MSDSSPPTSRVAGLLERARAWRTLRGEIAEGPLDERALIALLDPRVRQGARLIDLVARSWHTTLARLSRLGDFSDDNTITLFVDGDAAFTAKLAAIAAAKKRVWLETYIFADDTLGRRVRDALVDASLRGVDVMVLYDHFGSSSLKDGFFEPLTRAGARVVAFNPMFAWWKRHPIALPLLLRDHRKIIVVDDTTAFAGGMNISEDYAGPTLGNGRFRDTHLSITGTGARDLARTFAASFERATGDRLAILDEDTSARPPIAPLAKTAGTLVQVLRADPRTTTRGIQGALRRTVSRAVSRCFLTSPYFVPPRPLVRALVRSARRGVDVRVLTAGVSDVPIVRLASWHLYGRLLRGGVRIYELESQTLHAKTATIDGIYATVGSFNLDNWSHRRLLEVNVAMVDGRLAQTLEAQFVRDLASAREITAEMLRNRTLVERLIARIAYWITRL
jgi:cardiolipin synthase